jgi:DNA-binding NarL/FixJ family response regulator
MSTIRVLVVDDHALFRRGLISLIDEMPGMGVVGEAGDGRAALQVVADDQPDVVLLDVNMPGMSGVEVVQRLRDSGDERAILMLTISRRDEDLLGAIRAGADGYLLKDMEPEELRRAIVRAASGEGVLAPEVTQRVLRAIGAPEQESAGFGLSAREQEVLQELARGRTTAEIASTLVISENTVKTHVRHILEKLDAANRTEAVSIAVRQGLIPSKE